MLVHKGEDFQNQLKELEDNHANKMSELKSQFNAKIEECKSTIANQEEEAKIMMYKLKEANDKAEELLQEKLHSQNQGVSDIERIEFKQKLEDSEKKLAAFDQICVEKTSNIQY